MKDPGLADLQRNFSTWESWLTPLFPLPGPDSSHPSGLAGETAHREGAKGAINTQSQHGPLMLQVSAMVKNLPHFQVTFLR